MEKKFITYLKAKGLLPTSIKYYTYYVNSFLKYTNIKLKDFWDLKIFKKNYYKIIERNISNETKKKYLKCIRIFADFLVEEEIIEINTPRQITPPKAQTSLPIPVEDDEIWDIFKAIEKRWSWFLRLRNSILIETFLYTGLRRNELLNLKRENISENKIFVKAGKWAKDRNIYIPDNFSKKLQEFLKITAWVSEFLFYSWRKPKMSETTIKRIFEEIKKISGLRNIYPHRLRHTYASRMIEQWIDIAVVKEQMWHTNISTTNRYIAVRDSHRMQAIQKLKFEI